MAKQIFSNETIKRLCGILDTCGLTYWLNLVNGILEDKELPDGFEITETVRAASAVALSQVSIFYHDSFLYHRDFKHDVCVRLRKNMAFLLRLIKD